MDKTLTDAETDTARVIVARVGKIKLAALAAESMASCGISEDLSPDDYARDCPDIIVVRYGGTLRIVDGFHRVAGMVSWIAANGEANGVYLESVSVRAIIATGTDESIIGAAATPGVHQAAAIEVIEAAAYADAQ